MERRGARRRRVVGTAFPAVRVVPLDLTKVRIALIYERNRRWLLDRAAARASERAEERRRGATSLASEYR